MNARHFINMRNEAWGRFRDDPCQQRLHEYLAAIAAGRLAGPMCAVEFELCQRGAARAVFKYRRPVSRPVDEP